MGFFRNQDTHESRSSSMSYAMRWKQEHLRQVLLVGVLAIAVITIILIWFYTQNSKNIFGCGWKDRVNHHQTFLGQ